MSNLTVMSVSHSPPAITKQSWRSQLLSIVAQQKTNINANRTFLVDDIPTSTQKEKEFGFHSAKQLNLIFHLGAKKTKSNLNNELGFI